VIKGLNDAGFSEKEYRIAEEKPIDARTVTPVQQGLTFDDEKEEFLQFDDTVLRRTIDERRNASETSAIDSMLSSAEANSNAYDDAMKQAEAEPVGDLPLEVRSKVTTYPIYEQFKEEALSFEIPQFFIKATPSIFTLLDPNHKDLLTKEDLTDGFTLKDKDASIDFGSATEAVVEVDVQKNERPKYRQMSETESEYFKGMMQNLPPESRVKHCKLAIKGILEKMDSVCGGDLTDYIDRIVENMNADELAAMEKNIYGYAAKIKAKIERLVDEYRKDKFKNMLETGKIECLPSFRLKREINPGKPFGLLSKSLYRSEQAVNGFELKVIEKVSSLPNIKWWHRNMDRLEFCINGYLNHYPDFIVMTNSGKIVMIETKGEHLTSNDDSREKAELGKIWQAQAGANYRYYMVSEQEIASNPDATALDAFLRIMKEL
ncbi:MAG: restriction endonuclease, partial [Christensenellales bacterium]